MKQTSDVSGKCDSPLVKSYKSYITVAWGKDHTWEEIEHLVFAYTAEDALTQTKLFFSHWPSTIHTIWPEPIGDTERTDLI